jgi:general secretion pathway protein K
MLLVLALATVVMSSMMRSSYLAVRRTGNLIDATQARYFALGAEELGRRMLIEDMLPAGATKNVDHLREDWARQQFAFEIDEGRLTIAIVDQSGLYNLSGLTGAEGRADVDAIARFERLLQELGIDPALALLVADWQDRDDRTARGASEQSAYGASAIPNRPFSDIGEILAVPGVDADVWETLSPLVTALPEQARLNVNTAPPVVLLAYAPRATPAEIERFVQLRAQRPVETTSDEIAARVFGGAANSIDVKSDYFVVQSHAEYRQRHARIDTLMRRDPKTGKITIMARSDAAKL